MTIRNRIEKLEGVASSNGSRMYSESQWDGIILFCGAAEIPESMVVERRALERTAAYRWARDLFARREKKHSQLSEGERLRQSQANTKILSRHPEEWWADALRKRFIVAWERNIPGLPCPLLSQSEACKKPLR